MNENLNLNDIENDDLNLKNKDYDYNSLITRLEGIKTTISLLKKTVSK